MANTNGGFNSELLDEARARNDLDLLERSRSAAIIDQYLDFGPWWYAPLLATCVGGMTLFGEAFDNAWSIVAGLVALASGAIMAGHDYQRRKVRLRPTRDGFAFFAVVLLICLTIIGAWGTAMSSIGPGRFVPGYALLAWVLTTLVFLGIRKVLLLVREKRSPLT